MTLYNVALTRAEIDFVAEAVSYLSDALLGQAENMEYSGLGERAGELYDKVSDLDTLADLFEFFEFDDDNEVANDGTEAAAS